MILLDHVDTLGKNADFTKLDTFSTNVDDRRVFDPEQQKMMDTYTRILNRHPPGRKRDQLVNELIDGMPSEFATQILEGYTKGLPQVFEYLKTYFPTELARKAGIDNIGDYEMRGGDLPLRTRSKK